jgi:excisionase family DNA binding protein
VTEYERTSIIKEVLAILNTDGKDFTTRTLAELLDFNKAELSRIAKDGRIYGTYMCGSQYRFKRAEIMLRRALGKNLFKPII